LRKEISHPLGVARLLTDGILAHIISSVVSNNLQLARYTQQAFGLETEDCDCVHCTSDDEDE
jgi:hypothetical protein